MDRGDHLSAMQLSFEQETLVLAAVALACYSAEGISPRLIARRFFGQDTDAIASKATFAKYALGVDLQL